MMPKTSMTKENEVKKEGKTEVLCFKATLREREVIESHAEKTGMPLNQYLRSTILITMALEGNMDAMKIVFTGVRKGFAEALADKLASLKVQLPELT